MIAVVYLQLILIIVTDRLRVVQSKACEGQALRMDNFEDKIITQDVLSTQYSVLTAGECAIWCVRNARCMSFFHSKITARCQLHATVCNNTDLAQFESASRYYILHAEDIIPRIPSLEDVCSWSPDFFYMETEDVKLCIRHSKDFKLTASEARENCSKCGARLLQLETEQKYHVVVNLLFSDLDYGSVFIGATYMNNTWVWNWNINNPVQFFDWGYTTEQQPDGDGDCVRLSYTYDYVWADESCNVEKRFVCEIVTYQYEST